MTDGKRVGPVGRWHHRTLTRTEHGPEGGTPGRACQITIGGYAVRRMPYVAHGELIKMGGEYAQLYNAQKRVV